MKKRKVFSIVTVAVLVTITAVAAVLFFFTDIFKKTDRVLEGVLLDKDTGKETAYSIDILKHEDIKHAKVLNWIEKNKGGGDAKGETVFYLLYNQSDKKFDMYLFMPAAQDIIGDVSAADITVTEKETSVILNIDTKNIKTNTDESTDLILHVYLTGERENSMDKKGKLVIDGNEYTCGSSSYALFDKK